MSAYSGPELTNSGLVLAYDMGNTDKSWKGAVATNLLPKSVGISGQPDGSTLSSNAGTAPDGTFTADKITVNSANSMHQAQINLTGPVVSGQTYTFSVYLKPSGTPRVSVSYIFNGGTVYDNLLDLSTKTNLTNTNVFRFTSANNGWVRVESTFVANATSSPVTYLQVASPTATGPGQAWQGDGIAALLYL